ncbi:MAG: hypothetical protein KatS3mg002_0044 [Candidatus Woesearchaeota archaeon]|nr:MAG: hypothetical protein KatS3mg002_0044 [Candidatus Woesearchaeota archaeon]
MVSITVDFYNLRKDLLREIIRRIEKIEVSNYPLETAWLLYALSFEDRENNLFYQKGLNDLEKWALSESSGTKDKDLAPLSLCYNLSENKEVCEKAMEKIKLIIERNITKSPLPKFNVLNDPEQIFCVSLLSSDLPENIKVKLIEIIKKNINGSIIRNIFFSASFLAFGEDFNILDKLKPIDAEGVILSLWLAEHYRKKNETDVLRYWKLFESVYPNITINEVERGNYLSFRNLALLFEALVVEINEPNPNMLFDIYPLHPEIKKITKDHFKNKKYSAAIFQAIQKLKELIENKSGISKISENELVKTTMNPRKHNCVGKPPQKNHKDITIKFNDYLDKIEGINEQEGLALITEGIFKAFRNPRGHKPEDHELLAIGPYEALDQLILINYIWRRIEGAKT